MIVDLAKFIAENRPYWTELEERLDRQERSRTGRMPLGDVKRLHYLYQRASADLVRVKTFAAEPEITRYLETLVARGYSETQAEKRDGARFNPLYWFAMSFPMAVQRHAWALWTVIAVTMAGAVFGAGVLMFDPQSKPVLMPFPHLQGNPSERVAWEEKNAGEHLEGGMTSFSSFLMTNNTKVSFTAMALGMTWGIGTIILLFYNGVILGAVCADYILAGEVKFLAGWLLPHGAIEIPAIFLAGQAGLVLARAIIGWGSRVGIGARLRLIGSDLVTLIGGVALMLVWAGLVEAFMSQYHEPVLPYWAKIVFGTAELVGLGVFLFWKRKVEKIEG